MLNKGVLETKLPRSGIYQYQFKATDNYSKSDSVRVYYESSTITIQNSSKLQSKREAKDQESI